MFLLPCFVTFLGIFPVLRLHFSILLHAYVYIDTFFMFYAYIAVFIRCKKLRNIYIAAFVRNS